MTDTKTAHAAAVLADDAFEAAVKAAGFKSRWDVPNAALERRDHLGNAYYAKLAADAVLYRAFLEARRGR